MPIEVLLCEGRDPGVVARWDRNPRMRAVRQPEFRKAVDMRRNRDVIGVGHSDAEFGDAMVLRLKWCGDTEGGYVPAAASRVVVLRPRLLLKVPRNEVMQPRASDDGKGL